MPLSESQQPFQRPYSSSFSHAYTPTGRCEDEDETPLPLSQARDVMNSGFFRCLDHVPSCCLATFCPCVLFGMNYARVHRSLCLLGCCCAWCCYANTRSTTQRYVGVRDMGAFENCLVGVFCFCCMTSQEYRALQLMNTVEVLPLAPQPISML